MRLADFDFPFDSSLIATRPAEPRDAARLMYVPRGTGAWSHRGIGDLPALLQPGDLLVLNDTRVLPARVQGRKRPGGGRVTVLFVRERQAQEWEALLDGAGKAGQVIDLDGGAAVTVLRSGLPCLVRVEGGAPLHALLQTRGQMPLPPYIRRPPLEEDRVWYQTVFARREGSVAAPTAGLHFTERLLASLQAGGVDLAYVTLHVGPGTFRPVTSLEIEEHVMLPERFSIPAETAAAIERARAARARVIAVGTTVVRTLESAVGEQGGIRPGAGETALFITPGFRFRVVDGLLTNFHLPRSTLLMLVAAFAGLDRMRAAYAEAMRERYRLYSYGDAMLIV